MSAGTSYVCSDSIYTHTQDDTRRSFVDVLGYRMPPPSGGGMVGGEMTEGQGNWTCGHRV